MNLQEIGEFGLIDRLCKKLNPADESVVVGIGDDAAVVAYQPAAHVLMTTDMLVEGVHFREDTMDYQSVGWKSMAASISDIAAMGGIPRHAVVSLAIPPSINVQKLDKLYEGIADICQIYNTHVIGGDIVKTSGPLIISVTLTGEVKQGRALLRSGAKPGDFVFVTGSVGGSAAGLDVLLNKQREKLPQAQQMELVEFHQRPRPQVLAGQILLKNQGCTSCNDISDGLASELNEIAKASGVRIAVEEEQIPIAESVRKYANLTGKKAVDWALFGGEDYQLVGTLQPASYASLVDEFQKAGLAFSLIGRVTDGSGVVLQEISGGERILPAQGYNHFTD